MRGASRCSNQSLPPFCIADDDVCQLNYLLHYVLPQKGFGVQQPKGFGVQQQKPSAHPICRETTIETFSDNKCKSSANLYQKPSAHPICC